MTTVGFLDRSRIVAGPGWSRWLVPPAALAIHLAIGSVYAWSVFKIPLEKSLHISGTASALPFTIGIVMLGLSAAMVGTRVDHYGPRWAMFVATVCFCSGLLIAGFGVSVKQYWLVVFGYGVVGGIGLGIGYIVNAISDTQKAGKHGPHLSSVSFTVMIALLVVGLICNEFIGPVATGHPEPGSPDASAAPETVSLPHSEAQS